ncbi:hypothetical protein FA15DRAFT_661160 [Coprinopsis marcescibilis]|uniref:Nucleoplasmin-like domain-containing protein n=1 Tax=Coprinopsis marcescibilis TaxID=230819 RepID=A0A5C3KD12_COPMA|nr:hypothetical protein FA15DRAFT_661160 [Coprinopsis marcescibilis]
MQKDKDFHGNWFANIQPGKTVSVTPGSMLLLGHASLQLECPPGKERGALRLKFGPLGNEKSCTIAAFQRGAMEQSSLNNLPLKQGSLYVLEAAGPFGIDVYGYFPDTFNTSGPVLNQPGYRSLTILPQPFQSGIPPFQQQAVQFHHPGMPLLYQQAGPQPPFQHQQPGPFTLQQSTLHWPTGCRHNMNTAYALYIHSSYTPHTLLVHSSYTPHTLLIYSLYTPYTLLIHFIVIT